MAKKRGKARDDVPRQGTSAAASSPLASSSPAGSPRRFGLGSRLLLAVVVPTVVLVLLEVVLRVTGYGYPTTFFVPAGDGTQRTTNRKFGWSYMARDTASEPHPVLFNAVKPAGVKRIFILGESAALGTPEPALGFGRILEVMLRSQYPSNRFEVINAAMRGINSHAILPIARECCRYQPDVFLLYCGNNERVGFHAPEPGRFNLTPYRRLLQARQWIVELRISQAIGDVARRMAGASSTRPGQDMAFFRGKRMAAADPAGFAVDENFRANLDAILDAISACGAKTVVSSVAVNLRTFPPVASLHRANLSTADSNAWQAAFDRGIGEGATGKWKEALTHHLEAARIDDHYAELRFRMGRELLEMHRGELARDEFRGARDRDALQFRTDSRLNNILRDAGQARAGHGVHWADAEVAFAAHPASEEGIPGPKLFTDHVHFTFEGDYLLAQTFLASVADALELGAPAQPVPTLEACAQSLGYTEWEALGIRSAILRMLGQPPFQDQADHAELQKQGETEIESRTKAFQQGGGPQRVVALYRAAVARRPDDWGLRANFASALADFGNGAAAADEYQAAIQFMPVDPKLRVNAAQLLWKLGRKDAAIGQLEAALRLDPGFKPAREGIEALRGR